MTGGTNLMAIGMAFSATTHLMEVYYTLPGDKHPELRATPSKLVVDIPLIVETRPRCTLAEEKSRYCEDIRAFQKINSPAQSPLILLKKRKRVTSAVYAHLGSLMVKRGLLIKVETAYYSTTTLGDLAYSALEGKSHILNFL